MALKATSVSADSNPLEAGSYPGRLLWVFDLGKQVQLPYQGQERPPVHKILLTYEFSDEFLQDEDGNDIADKPRVISEQIPLYPLTSERATSTKRYFAMDPANIHEGDFAELVNVPVMLTVVQNASKKTGKIYNNLAGLSPMRVKDVNNLSPLVNEPRVFDLDVPDMEVWAKMHDWVKEIITNNLDFQGSALQARLAGGTGPTEDEPY